LSETADRVIDETPLGRRLLVAFVFPVALLLAAGALLGAQVANMADDAHWVEHSNEVIAKTYELQKQIIDQETGLRGLLVTGDRMFLEPYEKAAPLDLIKQLRALVTDSPAQQDRVDEIGRRYGLWVRETLSVARGDSLDEARSMTEMLDRKARMDSIRAAIDELLTVETGLRHQRSAAASASVQATRWAFVGILLALSGVLAFLSRRQVVGIAATFRSALEREREARARVQAEDWVRRGHVEMAEAIQGDRSPFELAEKALQTLATYVRADVGALYGTEGEGWRRLAGFALDSSAAGPERFKRGEGLIGQTASERNIRRISAVPADYVKVRSGTGERAPVDLVIVPAHSDGQTHAVIELGFLREADARTLRLVERVAETIAVAMRSSGYRVQLQELLEESQRQGEALQAQQEELRVTNEELETQTQALRQAHAQLEERKEELEVMNTSLLVQRSGLEKATRVIEEKAIEVERASRYKSEFLANMSHELRTPLNSSLILANLLASNKEGNLSDEQVKFASMIRDAGNDLLVLINDVLDLSKVEAGKIEVRARSLSTSRVAEEVATAVEPLAREKKVAFRVHVDASAPSELETDAQRLRQILRNLLSNAIKFTESGEVSLSIQAAGEMVAFAVADTGIGIAPDQHEAIFEAFRQAEGSANRRFGGTGLGLSISRSLARLLGGDLSVASEVGRGSTFTLTLPRLYVPPDETPHAPAPAILPPVPLRTAASAWNGAGLPIADDRDRVEVGRRIVLVVEDDPAFATILLDLAHELEFQCLVAGSADEGVQLALERVPSAILLDMKLPDHSGLSVLDRLKRDPTTRHIPIHVISGFDHSHEALAMGATGYVLKPVQREELLAAFRRLEDQLSRRVRRVLVVEDDDRQRESIAHLLARQDVEIVAVSTVTDALEKLRGATFDCVVTDLALPDASGGDLLDRMAGDDAYAFPPVIVYTGRMLTADEEQRLRRHSSSIIVKGARSPERLLDEVTLFLHQVESELPADQRRMLRQARDREQVFEGRRILIAEDDVRNIFALTSVLEPKGAEIVIARNGREAIAALETTPGIDLVLMDIMMPEMDGLEAMREIRQRGAWSRLPIIALTAKAMKDDQEQCLLAGANDYISKPLDVEMLLSLLRVWMPK
jgi:CheY-like chemotaxis protein/CHASE3 domain sensor protein